MIVSIYQSMTRHCQLICFYLKIDRHIVLIDCLSLCQCVNRLRQLIRQSSLDSIEPSDDDKMLENDAERHLELDQNLIRCLSYRAECVSVGQFLSYCYELTTFKICSSQMVLPTGFATKFGLCILLSSLHPLHVHTGAVSMITRFIKKMAQLL